MRKGAVFCAMTLVYHNFKFEIENPKFEIYK
jgi:hypothetical protein